VGEGSTDTPQGVGHGGGEVGHVPVLLQEAIDFLNVRRGGTYIDATVGLGGHSYEIARRLGAPGHLIGLDKDPAALEIARKRLQGSAGVSPAGPDWPTITLLHRSFAEIANDRRPATVDGILADIGVSSLQLNDAARGFSFQAEGPLDMRMDPRSERTSGKPPRRARACRCDLRIRRGKEVAENRQSHCPVAADTIYRSSCGCHISRGPANEF
jgi:16S rRNA (cytosine1402-N4)-methyltransferase